MESLAQLDAAMAALDVTQGIPLQLQAPDGRTRAIVVGGPAPR